MQGLYTYLNLDALAPLALLTSFGAFVAMLVWVCWLPRPHVDRTARLPLDDENP